MKTFTLGFFAGALAMVLLGRPNGSVGKPATIAVVNSEKSAKPAASAVSSSSADEMRKEEGAMPPDPQKSEEDTSEILNPDGSLKRLPSSVKYWNFWGWIEQHLDDGYLLVKCGGRGKEGMLPMKYYALLLPGADHLADGAEVRFAATVIGTYKYNTVSGSTNTVHELLYLPPEALPTPAIGEDSLLRQRPKRR